MLFSSFELGSLARKNKTGSRTGGAARRFRGFSPGIELCEARIVQSTMPLHVAGNVLADAANNTVVLRGVNVISLEWRPDGDNVMKAVDIAIKDWHANLLRLPVNEDFWFGHNQAWGQGEAGDGGAAYRSIVDQVISTAKANNVYVMLDLHWSDMGVTGTNNGQHFMPDMNSLSFWQDAAPRYANDPAVMFDPYNEPHFQNDQPTDTEFGLWRDGGQVHENGEFNGSYQSPGMQGLIDAIRAGGANNIVAPEGLNWGSNLAGVLNGHALSDPAGNLMYQVHLYPNKLADNQVASSVLAVAQNYPIYVGEWGSGGIQNEYDPNAAQSNQDILAYLDKNNFNWTAWALTPDLGGEYNMLTSWDANAAGADYGVFVKDNLTAHANGQPIDPPAPPAAPNVTASFADLDDWGFGFTGSITLVNSGNTDVNGWTLEFDFAGNITDIWNGQLVSHVGNHYVIQNADWNGTIAAGQAVSFGFNADWNGALGGPTNYVLNGWPINYV